MRTDPDTARPPAEPRAGARVVALWTALFVLHRAAVLLGAFDRVFYWEETYRLIAAQALVGGWNLPLLDLQADTYAGGSLVVALLAAPVVALAGPSVLALKSVALAWSALGFVAWAVLVDRHWGRRALHGFALSFVLAPPLFVAYNLVAMGSHAEVVTLGGLQLLLAYRCLFGPPPPARTVVTWGAIAGFGTWFAYVSVLPFVACVVTALGGRALAPRRWAALAGGFAAGLTPWLLSNVLSGGRGLEVVARTFGGAGGEATALPGYGATLLYLLRTGVPLALGFHDLRLTVGGGVWHVPRALLAHGYLALYAVCWAVLVAQCARAGGDARGLRAVARRPEVPLVLLFPLFVLVIAGSDHVFLAFDPAPFLPFRVLVPALPAVFCTVAVAAARARPTWRVVALTAVALIGIAGTVELVQGAGGRARIERAAPSLGAQAMGHLLVYKHGSDLPLLATRVAAMPAELQPDAYAGIGFSLAYHHPAELAPAALTSLLARIDPAHRGDAIRGARVALGPGMEQVPRLPITARTGALLAEIDRLDAADPGH